MEHLAYLDAGAGSLFFQAVLGSALAASLFLKNIFKNAIGKLRYSFSRKSLSDAED
jgi:hypothetical protein